MSIDRPGSRFAFEHLIVECLVIFERRVTGGGEGGAVVSVFVEIDGFEFIECVFGAGDTLNSPAGVMRNGDIERACNDVRVIDEDIPNRVNTVVVFEEKDVLAQIRTSAVDRLNS